MTPLLIISLFLGAASARLGMGPCPTTYPQVINPTKDLEDGRFYAFLGDENAIWAFNKFLKSKTQKMDCFAANVTKTTPGLHWDPYTVLEALKYCKQDVRCDATKATCNCYVYARPMELVYFDSISQTGAIYQCTDFKAAFDTAEKNLNYPFYMKVLRAIFSPVINSLHYTGIGVFSQQNVLDATALGKLTTFINSFPDEIEGGYNAPWQAKVVASAWGYNGNATLSMGDLAAIDQSEATCKWSQRP